MISVVHDSKFDIMWDNLIEKALTNAERDECFMWLIQARKPPVDCFCSIDDVNVVHLFLKRMLKVDPSQQSSLSFKCFQRYFCDTNVKKNKLIWKEKVVVLF